jgi:phenylacetate-CoA ligase
MLDVITILSGAHWPAIPAPRAAQLLAIQFQLEQSQWLPPEELADAQLKQLARVVAYARESIPFYRERLSGLTLAADQPIDLSEWRTVSLLDRFDLQTYGDRMQGPANAKERSKRATSVTSGSTGTPVSTVSTTLTRLIWNAITLRQHIWHRRNLKLKFAAIRWRGMDDQAFSETSRGETWGTATAGVVRTGPAVSLDIRNSIQRQAEWLIEEDPYYLLTYPSNALALARHFIEYGLTITNLREVRTFGESLDTNTRRFCRQAWDVPVVDNYSTQEVGYIALQCPTGRGYHLQSENVLVEVIDDKGQPCGPQQVGRVVVSTLQNFAQPLFRYDIGDYAEVGEPCSCGRGLPVLNRILGRRRNMFRLADGTQIWPSLSMEPGLVPNVVANIRQFQVVQLTIEQLKVRLVTSRSLDTDDERELVGWLHCSLGYPFRVEFDYVRSIERSAGGKFEDFCSLIGD